MTQNDHQFRLRPAAIEDSSFLIELSNDPTVVAASSSLSVVSEKEHARWYPAVIDSEDHMVCTIESVDPISKIGFARLDMQPDGLASISIALVESWRGRSIGTEVIRQIAALGFRRWSFLQGVVALVRNGNRASARAVLRADFVPTDLVALEDHAVYVLRR